MANGPTFADEVEHDRRAHEAFVQDRGIREGETHRVAIDGNTVGETLRLSVDDMLDGNPSGGEVV